MENLRIIEVSYLGATNTLPSRVKLKEVTDGLEDTKIISFTYVSDNIKEQAIEYLTNIGINIVSTASTKDKCVLLSDSWARDKDFNCISIKG